MPRGSWQTKRFSNFTNLRLGVIANWKQSSLQFLLIQDMQNIRLIFGKINGSQEFLPSAVRRPPSGVVSCRHKVRAERQCMIQQKRPADLTVAQQTWIRRLTARVAVQEILDDGFAKNIFRI